MIDKIKLSRDMRARIAEYTGQEILIFKENPLFEYFADDSRLDGILLKNGKILLIGNKEIDSGFQEEFDSDRVCCLSPFYQFRKCKECHSDVKRLFDYPTKYEIDVMIQKTAELNGLIVPILQSISKEHSEFKISQMIKRKLCEYGFFLFYDPFVAYDENTLKLWNKPGDKLPQKLMYFETSVRTSGLSTILSETILFSDSREYLEKYQAILDAIGKIKSIYIEGESTLKIAEELEPFRNKNLYLTTPLFPFSHTAIPGEDKIVKTGDVSVFDLWVWGNDYSIRKKVVAIAGSYIATII